MAFGDILNIEDAQGRGYKFPMGDNIFYAGLFDFNEVEWPDIVQPKLLLKDGDDWKVIKETDVIWKDVQEDIYPNPEHLAINIINAFNKELEKYQEGGELTYVQKLALIFQIRLALAGNELVIKPK